jgi:trans-feruloyl-CoA hydratase/vanillin synthase
LDESQETLVTSKQYNNVLVKHEGGITFVVLNRPDQRNAMSPELHYEMEDAIDWVATDDDTKVLVLAGAGESWCAGQDIRLYFRATQGDPGERQRSNAASHRWRWEKLKTFPKPTIAMVNGYCYGAAFTQLCAVDFVITSESALYGLSEVNWGIIPGGIVSWNLMDMILPRHALYYAVTGEPFDGKRAVEIGLANFAVPADKLREETIKFAEKLMKLNPSVVRYTKEAMRAVRGMSDDQARDYLRGKQDSLARNDKEIRDQVGMTQFLDEKSFRPGLEPYRREEG